MDLHDVAARIEKFSSQYAEERAVTPAGTEPTGTAATTGADS